LRRVKRASKKNSKLLKDYNGTEPKVKAGRSGLYTLTGVMQWFVWFQMKVKTSLRQKTS
jgi:hypothetical protein